MADETQQHCVIAIETIEQRDMPACEGLPNGPCLKRRNDKSVSLGKGDSMLYPECVEPVGRTTGATSDSGDSSAIADFEHEQLSSLIVNETLI
jgi:hypothetical protein